MALLTNFASTKFRSAERALTVVVLATLVFMLASSSLANSQAYQVLHSFTVQGADGNHPDAGVTLDRAENLYGVTAGGGPHNWGTVFKMTRHGAAWTLASLYSFGDIPDDGQVPVSRLVFGPDGSLYGTTEVGGGDNSYGTVFSVKPPPRICQSVSCPWVETVLHRFTGGEDGAYPGDGELLLDAQGNVYGTTTGIGASAGTVFKLSRQNGAWQETILYSFTHGETPESGVTFDNAGNLYGTTEVGGAGFGQVFKLTPSGSGWVEEPVYVFQNNGDGANPQGGLVFDSAGNLYGSTVFGGGTVFELKPSNGGWNFTTVYNFSAYLNGPSVTLSMDAAGNLYGTLPLGGAIGSGIAFKLTRSGDTWTFTDLYDFGRGLNGGHPYGSVALDSAGSLYSTTNSGGAHGQGVVWELTP